MLGADTTYTRTLRYSNPFFGPTLGFCSIPLQVLTQNPPPGLMHLKENHGSQDPAAVGSQSIIVKYVRVVHSSRVVWSEKIVVAYGCWTLRAVIDYEKRAVNQLFVCASAKSFSHVYQSRLMCNVKNYTALSERVTFRILSSMGDGNVACMQFPSVNLKLCTVRSLSHSQHMIFMVIVVCSQHTCCPLCCCAYVAYFYVYPVVHLPTTCHHLDVFNWPWPGRARDVRVGGRRATGWTMMVDCSAHVAEGGHINQI